MKNRHRHRLKLISYLQWHRPEIKNLWPIFFISRDIFIVPSKSKIDKGKEENAMMSIRRKWLAFKVFGCERGHFERLLVW